MESLGHGLAPQLAPLVHKMLQEDRALPQVLLLSVGNTAYEECQPDRAVPPPAIIRLMSKSEIQHIGSIYQVVLQHQGGLPDPSKGVVWNISLLHSYRVNGKIRKEYLSDQMAESPKGGSKFHSKMLTARLLSA